MEIKWFCVVVAIIVIAISVEGIFINKSKEQTKQAALKAIEQGADPEVVNRILNSSK